LKVRILAGEGFQVFAKSKYICLRKSGTFLAIAKKDRDYIASWAYIF
jgi:hypothetical protein